LIGESYGTFPLGGARQLSAITRQTVHLKRYRADFLGARSFPRSRFARDGPAVHFYLPSTRPRPVPQDPEGPAPRTSPDHRRSAQVRAGEYAAALFKGAELGANEKAAVAKKVSYFTGLSEDYLMKADLRVQTSVNSRAELQRSSRLTTGRTDARFTATPTICSKNTLRGDPEGPAVEARLPR